MTGLIGQITEVDSADDQFIDCTLYSVGQTDQQNFEVSYADLTAEQKTTVDNFRALLIALAPQE